MANIIRSIPALTSVSVKAGDKVSTKQTIGTAYTDDDRPKYTWRSGKHHPCWTLLPGYPNSVCNSVSFSSKSQQMNSVLLHQHAQWKMEMDHYHICHFTSFRRQKDPEPMKGLAKSVNSTMPRTTSTKSCVTA